MKFSEKVKILRQNANLTQQELSSHIGITASAIGYLENGQRDPTGSTLIAYAKFFNVSIDSLVGLEPDIEDSIFSAIPTITKQQPIEKPADLSADELTLVKQYRSLHAGYKALIENQIKFLVEQQKALELPSPVHLEKEKNKRL